ncbi:hypothetical protein TELCIR_06403 [Teladorsagia circumcincta]|uniref:Uncharacterized protein n=1 Tax=Teladorsagia circumcincta TaxID=45464 RepID=A0A2G9UN34_TELCI|nr:hypothetical protein TELCIR_06403 [Teladorsagia circumcincta]
MERQEQSGKDPDGYWDRQTETYAEQRGCGGGRATKDEAKVKGKWQLVEITSLSIHSNKEMSRYFTDSEVDQEESSSNDEVSMKRIGSDLHLSRRSVQIIVKFEPELNSHRLLRVQMLSLAAKKNRLQKCKKLSSAVHTRLSDIV